jgi:hypothetical protein
MPVRIWWTSDKVLDLAPVPPPAQEDLDIFGLRPPHGFVVWCFDRYLEPTQGRAVLTEVPFELPAGLFFADFFLKRYPSASVVDTVYCRKGGDKPSTTAVRPRD